MFSNPEKILRDAKSEGFNLPLTFTEIFGDQTIGEWDVPKFFKTLRLCDVDLVEITLTSCRMIIFQRKTDYSRFEMDCPPMPVSGRLRAEFMDPILDAIFNYKTSVYRARAMLLYSGVKYVGANLENMELRLASQNCGEFLYYDLSRHL